MNKKLFAVILFLMVFVMGIKVPLITKAEDAKKENSWRYENGQLIQKKKQKEKARTRTTLNAWSKVDGQYVNDNGEIIEGAIEKGIDVSEWQGNIDWEKVKSTDVDYAIIRCGYSTNYSYYDDKKWKRNADECTRLGIPFGTYLYSYATTVEQAKSEAEHVLRLVEGYSLRYPIYFDMEDQSTISIGKEKMAEIAKTFCDTISAAGYKVGIYANTYWWNTYLTDSIYDNWCRWVAQYNSWCSYKGDYQMWQCASDGTVSGIEGNVDINFGFGRWKVKDISTDTESPQPMKKSVRLSAKIAGDKSGLQYKFVWQKDNWNKWGVLKNFDNTDNVTWMPDEAGTYTLYLDVKDTDETVTTITKKYTIKNWGNNGIDTDLESPQVKNDTINLKANVVGDSKNLQYKFVWQKDNWEKWRVIENFSDNPEAKWSPTEAGDYYLYVDVKDAEGVKDTKIIAYKIVEKSWTFKNIQISGNNEVGEKIEIQPVIDSIVPNHKSKLQYKYVWMKDDWKEWGVIKDFSTNKEMEWMPEEEGDYYLYVDVKENGEDIETKRIEVKISEPTWTYEDIDVSLLSPQLSGTSVTFTPIIDGNKYGIQYKYVWMKDNWKEWGVIKNFSSDEKAEFSAKQSGVYTIYIDVKGLDGQIKTLTKSYTFIDKVWEYYDVKVEPDSVLELGEQIQIVPEIEKTDAANLQYKYVWQKDNWKEWGVISDFSGADTMSWMPNSTGEYKIYVDVKDQWENKMTKIATISVKQGGWQYQKLEIAKQDDGLFILPQISGKTYKLQYKYVWMKDNWKEWGVISDFSENQNVEWKTNIKGKLSIYVDVRDQAGKIVTQKQEINVE